MSLKSSTLYKLVLIVKKAVRCIHYYLLIYVKHSKKTFADLKIIALSIDIGHTCKNDFERRTFPAFPIKTQSQHGDDDGVGGVNCRCVTNRRHLEGQVGRQQRHRAHDCFDPQANALGVTRGFPPGSAGLKWQQGVGNYIGRTKKFL